MGLEPRDHIEGEPRYGLIVSLIPGEDLLDYLFEITGNLVSNRNNDDEDWPEL